jgi:hypothetical protein
MPVDVLLVGEYDLPQPGDPNTGTPQSSTKVDYFNLFLSDKGNMYQDDPFNVVSRNDHLQVGSHLMWTLPYALRRGKQVVDADGNVSTQFPNAPNRWLVTRFEYTGPDSSLPPSVTGTVVVSDLLSEAEFPASPHSSNYPLTTGNYPVSKIGEAQALEQYGGEELAASQRFTVQAVGPGSVSWSVTYDNVRNVFGLHDKQLSPDATAEEPYYYTYSVVGWYADPADDALFNLATTDAAAWSAELAATFQWQLGDSAGAVQDALSQWREWQRSHGLLGDEPADLPTQAQDHMEAWLEWQQANGAMGPEPDLARQSLCHAMVSSIEWKGTDVAYGSGNPQQAREYPTLAVADTAVEAISTYMADKIVNDSGMDQPSSDVPEIARALEAFQKDLLYDYEKDPVKVENQLHTLRFSKSSAGKEWIVVRKESTEEQPSPDAGKQSVSLPPDQTQALTDLNTRQNRWNELNNTIASQRDELYLVRFKTDLIGGGAQVPATTQTQVKQSQQALTAALGANLNELNTIEQSIATSQSDLSASLGDDYVLKSVDLPAFSAPNDPVIMIAGAKLDTKLASNVVDLSGGLLAVRYTGQFVTALKVQPDGELPMVIDASKLLDKVVLPPWNAFPKEVVDLLVETLLLDPLAAGLLASIYREDEAGTEVDQSTLTARIRGQQEMIWADIDAIEYPRQAILDAAGFTGIAPALAAISFRKRQPWTPLFVDWSVRWIPTSRDASTPFQDWKLGEIDYDWQGDTINDSYALDFTGRSILVPGIATAIQEKMAGFENDPNYDDLPQWLRDDLAYGSEQIKNLDVLTQSLTGFNQQLITRFIAASRSAPNPDDDDAGEPLGGSQESYAPELTNPNREGTSQQFAPIRSGHLQVRNVWVVDAFGQIMFAAANPTNEPPKSRSPLTDIKWSENMHTPGAGFSTAYGQLAPRLTQAAKVQLRLLQRDDDTVFSNSADATSPISGWVMPNHLDNSLMIYDAEGNSLGSVIKVQSETTSESWSVRWDAAVGTQSPLGAPPDIANPHLSGFVLGLLETGYSGAAAYDALMASIDSSLWVRPGRSLQHGNLALLMGKPLAVVRAQIGLELFGTPVYPQAWAETGAYYNREGQYVPTPPPYLSKKFAVRLGDAQLNENGVFGYFQADDYTTFFPVYGARGQTLRIRQSLRSSLSRPPTFDMAGPSGSDYVQPGHLLDLQPDGPVVKLTVLMDPSGILPVFAGALPYQYQTLPNGPVSAALNRLEASFRVGPLLTDPAAIRMPLPSEMRGKWSWLYRETVSDWSTEAEPEPQPPVVRLGHTPLRLTEGWLRLRKSSKEDQ